MVAVNLTTPLDNWRNLKTQSSQSHPLDRCLLNIYFLNIYYVPSTILGTGYNFEEKNKILIFIQLILSQNLQG